MDYKVHPQAICEGANVGTGTKIGAFTHVLPNAVIGTNCKIYDGVFIENDVVIGDRVDIKSGVKLLDGMRIEDDVFIGPNATFANDHFICSRYRNHPEKMGLTYIKKRASIGANATVLPGIVVGTNAMVGAGAVVVRSVPPNAIVVGNPARIIGYADSKREKKKYSPLVCPEGDDAVSTTSVQGVTLHRLTVANDMRGNLVAMEFMQQVPFVAKRCFMVYDVPSAEVRGEHAHRHCQQFLICAKGSCSVVADDGTNREEFLLDNPFYGIYLPPMIWGTQYRYTSDAVLVVFASDYYEHKDYVRDYQEYLDLIKR